MVYCGKPSKGCQNCRERKIRCDQARPGCGQCAKVQKECPGYRNLIDLAFRNESDNVIRKAKARTKGSRIVAGQASTKPQTKDEPAYIQTLILGDASSIYQTSDSSVRSPSYLSSISSDTLIESDVEHYSVHPLTLSSFAIVPTTEQRGTSFFVNNFVAPHSWPSQGHFSFLDEVCRKDGLDEWLMHGMAAVGLACQANSTKSTHLMYQARKEYTAALRATNNALRSSDATKDSTLLTIMVLSIFETVTGKKESSMKAWAEHLSGAAELIKLRGDSQLKTQVGYGMFLQITSHYMIACMQRDVPLPPDLARLRTKAIKQLNGSVPATPLLAAVDRFTAFRAAMKSGTLAGPESILREGLAIDGLFASVFKDVEREWFYETVYTDTDPEVIYNGRYDIYYDYWVAQIWNSVRACRLLLNERIRGQLLIGFASVPPLFLSEEYTALLQTTTETILQMRDEILYSVPQHIGYVTRKPFTRPSGSVSTIPTRNTNSSSPPDYSASPSILDWRPKEGPVIAAAGYFLLWPLFVSGLTRLTSPEVRELTIERLRYVADVMGMQQAHACADYLASMMSNIDMSKPGYPMKRPLFGQGL
ncbi:hypothetical protein F5884DRAFT_524046 [Xylogone sp. PMI_703]|nr:hypothetical protein F5884DRAFT_524046 [Xylogone sp. PMI_703]